MNKIVLDDGSVHEVSDAVWTLSVFRAELKERVRLIDMQVDEVVRNEGKENVADWRGRIAE